MGGETIPVSWFEKIKYWISDMYDLLVANLTLQETGGTLTSTAAEQNIYINNAPLGVHKPRWLYVNLDAMLVADAIEIREYYRISAGGNLEQTNYTLYSGIDGGLANGNKQIRLPLGDNRFGCKFTLIRTAGVDHDFPWEYFEEA